MKQTICTLIKKDLKKVIEPQIYGKPDRGIKAKGLFYYMGFYFYTAREGKNWFAYEFTSNCLTVQFANSEAEVIRQTKHKIDIYCKNKTNLWLLVRGSIIKDGFHNAAKYTNLLPKNVYQLN